MAVSLHATGDLAPSGRFTVRALGGSLTGLTVSVAGRQLTPIAGSDYRIPPGAAPGDTIVISASGVTRTLIVADSGPTTWLVPLATQSNMMQPGVNVSNDAVAWPSSAKIITPWGTLATPSGVLDGADGQTGYFLIAKHFAINFLAARPHDTIVFVTCVRGTSSFYNNRWNPGDDLYRNLVSLTRRVLFANPTFRLRVLLVQCGENDGQNSSPAATFRAALEAFVTGLRADLSQPELPMVFGELPNDFCSNAARQAIRDQVLDLPNTMPYVATASSRTPTVVGTTDATHFSAAACMAMGARHYAALAAADANAVA